MKRRNFSLRRRQVMAISTIGAGSLAAPAVVMAVHDPVAEPINGKIVVSGRIVGAPHGQPLAGAQVEIWQADARGVRDVAARDVAVTDGDGRYFVAINATRANRIQYRVSHPGYTAQITQVRASGTEQRAVTLTRDSEGATRAAFEMTLAPRDSLVSGAADIVAL